MTPEDALVEFKARLAQRTAAQMALAGAEAALIEADAMTVTAEQVNLFFNVLSEQQRQALEHRVQSLVDYGVQAVFGPTHRFRVRSELRGKSVRTEFFLVEDGNELSILDATGGGVADVVAFLLRIVMLCLSRPVQQRVLVLDEPFKFLSASHFHRFNQLLTELTAQLGMQVILVSHRPEILDAATTVIQVSKAGKTSSAEVRRVA